MTEYFSAEAIEALKKNLDVSPELMYRLMNPLCIDNVMAAFDRHWVRNEDGTISPRKKE